MLSIRPRISNWLRYVLLFGSVIFLCTVISLQQKTSFDKPNNVVTGLKDRLREALEEGRDSNSQATAGYSVHTQLPHSGSQHPPCRNIPGADDILLVLKTGATEIYDKLPAHFLTTFRCTKDVLLLSDYEQDIGAHHVYDILADISPDIVNQHPDFQLYREQQQWGKELQETLELTGGWNLDKWKFLPMARKAYEEYPDKKWYVFTEADTYMVWTNLLAWLDRLDHTQPLYLGGRSFVGKLPFAHGGSGFVLSHTALQRLNEMELMHEKAWESKVPTVCCGDAVLAAALQEANVNLTQCAPAIQSDPPNTITWTRERWCTPALSWHHVTGAEVDALWEFEQGRLKEKGRNSSIMFSDYFDYFVDPYIQPTRADWDNLSREWEYNGDQELVDESTAAGSEVAKDAHQSASNCRNACIARHDCLQYSYEPHTCRISSVIILGKPNKEERREIESGWLTDRIRDFRSELEPCGPERGWVIPRSG